MSHFLLCRRNKHKHNALLPWLPETQIVCHSLDRSNSYPRGCHRPGRRKRESSRRREARYVSSRRRCRRSTWLSLSPCSPLSPGTYDLARDAHSALSPDHVAAVSCASSSPRLTSGPTYSRERLTGRRGTTVVSALRAGNALARSLARSTAAARRVPVFLAGGPHFTRCPVPCSPGPALMRTSSTMSRF